LEFRGKLLLHIFMNSKAGRVFPRIHGDRHALLGSLPNVDALLWIADTAFATGVCASPSLDTKKPHPAFLVGVRHQERMDTASSIWSMVPVRAY